MNILILYAEVMPYNIPVFKEITKMGYRLNVVQIDKKKLTPYKPEIEGMELKNLSSFSSYGSFKTYCDSVNPVLIMVSEVMEKWYWKYIWRYSVKHNDIPVVCGSDAQWTGNLHNWMKKLAFRFTYGQSFTHILSAGLWQVDYATRIGFKRDQILTPLYCANNGLYQQVDLENKKMSFPKRFIFVGRLNPVKGIANIIDAWDGIADKQGWKLTMIGNGDMADEIQKHADIELRPFMSQSEICKLMNESGCALIPSLYEPWGLVIHEAAAAAMPIIVSKHCGATYKFVVNGLNGYTINENSTEELKLAMLKIMNSSSSELYEMGKHSRRLSYNIQPIDVASALVSLIK